MTQYIDKSALVAKIEELDNFWHLFKDSTGQAIVEDLLSFIDTLEVKEMQEEHYAMSDTGSYTTTTKAQKGK